MRVKPALLIAPPTLILPHDSGEEEALFDSQRSGARHKFLHNGSSGVAPSTASLRTARRLPQAFSSTPQPVDTRRAFLRIRRE